MAAGNLAASGMTELRLLADRSGLHEGTPWALLDDQRQVIRTGVGIEQAPVANCVLIVIPDEYVSIIRTPLPKLAAKRLSKILPTIVEDHILASPDAIEAKLLETAANGYGTIAAFDRDWMSRMLLVPAVSSSSVVRVVTESWGIPRG